MSDLEELYQEVIMEHNLKPRNFRRLEDGNRSSDGFNPFCGDTITLYLKLEDDHVVDVGFQGSGCAISRASASMMTESIKGKSTEETEHIFEAFHRMLTQGTGDEPDLDDDDLGDLAVMSGVSKFPTRVKCATLSWHTLRAAMEDEDGTVKTE